MTLTFGVIGPTDLVPRVTRVADSTPGVAGVPLPYTEEHQTPDLLDSAADQVDGWLFTGVVPFQIANSERELVHPAEHVSYSGLTLLGALFRLASSGEELSTLSIDTLTRSEVSETLAVAGLPQSAARVLTYRPELGAQEFVEFHTASRAQHDAKVAITCLRSAYEALRDRMPVVRLEPSDRDVRESLDALVLQVQNRHHLDAQVVLGLVELDRPDEGLEADLAVLGGTVVPVDAGRYLLVTTRGALDRATDDFRHAPFLGTLAERRSKVQIGLGLGRSAADAAANASQALRRAARQGDVAAVVIAPHNTVRVLQSTADGRPRSTDGPSDLGRLAVRLGLSRRNLTRLAEHLATLPEPLVTSIELAESFDVTERSARRLLKHLERAGVAVRVGTARGQAGRPPTIYRVDL